MLTLKESTLVLAKIRVHHGNAAITDLEARTFHEELRADMTLGEALEAVKRFYADNSTGCWCGSGGNGPEQAQQQALTMRNPLELPAAQPKSRSTARRFAGAQKLGAASLGSILRGA